MATLIYHRKKQIYHPDGRFEEELVEERRSWPMRTCLNFKEAFPDAFDRIEADAQTYDNRQTSKRASTPSQHNERTPASKPVETEKTTGLGLADAINEEVAKL